jgi:hypothetical protein
LGTTIAGAATSLAAVGIPTTLDGILRETSESWSCNWTSKRREPHVEVKLVERASVLRARERHRRVTTQRDPRRLLPEKRRLVGRDVRVGEHILPAELGVVVELSREVQATVVGPVTVTQQSGERLRRLGRLGRVRAQALDERILWAVLLIPRIARLVGGHDAS